MKKCFKEAIVIPNFIRMKWITFLVLLGFIFAVFYCYYQGSYLSKGYPFNTFLFLPNDVFNDFWVILDVNKDLNPYFGPIVSAQYPLLNFLGFCFSVLSKKIASFIYITTVMGSVIYLIHFGLKKFSFLDKLDSLLILPFLSSPVLFTLDRGNFEGIVFVFLTFFAIFFYRKFFFLSAVMLSFATALKIFPILFILLFLRNKKIKAALLTLILTLLLSFISLAFFKSSFIHNLKFILHGQNFNNVVFQLFLDGNNFVQRGPSLFTLLKSLLVEFDLERLINFSILLKYYKVCMLGVAGIIGSIVLCVRLQYWQQLFLITASVLLLPQISAYYKMIHLLIPLTFYLLENSRTQFDFIYVFFFAFFLIPKPYFYLTKLVSDGGTSDISFGVFSDPILLIIMALVIIVTNNPVRDLSRKIKALI